MYFYGMFTDEDAEYVEFHNKCQEMFIKRFGKSKSINKKALISFSDNVKKAYDAATGKTIDSLLRLLDALVEKVSIDYSDLLSEDKYNLLLDIFENRQYCAQIVGRVNASPDNIDDERRLFDGFFKKYE